MIDYHYNDVSPKSELMKIALFPYPYSSIYYHTVQYDIQQLLVLILRYDR